MLGPFEQVCDFVESAEKRRKLVAKWRSNWIELLPDFHTTFSLFSIKLDGVENRLSNSCSTFAGHSFAWCACGACKLAG